MAEVNEQAGMSNCPIFNELDNKLPNTVIDRDVHTESSTFEQTEKSDDALHEDSDIMTCSDITSAVEQDTSLPNCTNLLTAFQQGLEQTVALVQHMSKEEKNRAWRTLQGLVVEKTLLSPEGVTVSGDNPDEYCQAQAAGTTSPERTLTGAERCTGKVMVSSAVGEVAKSVVTLTPVVKHRPVTRSSTLPAVVKQEISEEVTTVLPKRKRGRPRKNLAGSTPTPVPQSDDLTSNVTRTRGRRKRQLSNQDVNNENNNDKIIEPTANGDDLKVEEEEIEEEQEEMSEEVPVELGGDDLEKKMTYATVEKTSAGWLCTICGKVSSAKHNLLVHLRIHTGEKPYNCKLCPKKFSVISNLQRHTKDVHSGYKPYLCNHCDATFHNKRALNKHIKSQHVDNTVKVHQCPECGKCFKVLAVLEAHMVLHSGDQPFVCSQCSRRFTFRTNLLRHMKIHTGDRPHKCKQCGKGFIERKSLVLHIDRLHLGIKPCDLAHCFTCATCKKTFTSRANLNTHNFVHTGQKPHACPDCGKKFSLSSNMRRHLLTHSGEKPWECNDCHKCFTEKRSLEVHKRLHTGERPYACKICGKTFMQPGTLQSHMPVHSKTRAFSCDKCGKSFLRKSHMNFHMKKHKVAPQFACVFCMKRFYRKSDMDRHLLKHTNEKPFACELCPKRFSRLQYLKEHCNMHTGARPYKCEHCDMAFADMSSCYKHRKTHMSQSGMDTAVVTTDDAGKPDSILMTTDSPVTSHVSVVPKQSLMTVSTVDLQDLKAVENIMSLANVQMIFSSEKDQIVDGTCITPATSTEISELDKIVYETLLPSDQSKALPDDTVQCKDVADGAAIFKDLSPEQATQLRVTLARSMSLEVPDATATFAVEDSDLATVFIQEGCDKSSEVSVAFSQGQFTDTSVAACSDITAVGNAETVTDVVGSDVVTMVKLADVSLETDSSVIGKLYPEPMCGTSETNTTDVTGLAESVSVHNGVELSPVQLVGVEGTTQYFLVLSGNGQKTLPAE